MNTDCKKIQWSPLIISILISLLVGALSSLVTVNMSSSYQNITQPSFAPPPYIFPIVWTILFILMGISAYLIYMSDSPKKGTALKIYALQLVINFFWSPIFFNLNAYFLAFLWILLLWFVIIIMIYVFDQINSIAAYLQFPYFLWVTFAAYLTYTIYQLNG